MPEIDFPQFRLFIEEALEDLGEAEAASDAPRPLQSLSDWWSCFSIVVVPDLLLKKEPAWATNAQSGRQPGATQVEAGIQG